MTMSLGSVGLFAFFSIAGAVSLPALAATPAPLSAQKRCTTARMHDAAPLTLARIHNDPPLEGTSPTQATLSPDGQLLAFLRPSANDAEVLDLWGQRLPAGTPQLLVSTTALLHGAKEQLTEQERMALERKRISQRGITSYLWCGDKSDALLFPLSGDLYYAKLKHDGAPHVVKLTDGRGPYLDPQCNNSGTHIAFHQSRDVYVLDIQSKKTTRLTHSSSPTTTFGLAEFIAEEEMDRHHGLWWSPNGEQVLVFEVDESMVNTKVRAQIFADRTEMFEQRYPAAGEQNARVTAHVIDVKTGKDTVVRLPTRDGYLARAGFLKGGKNGGIFAPYVMWQSRDQKTVEVHRVNADGSTTVLLEEKDPAWVALTNDLYPLSDGRLLWTSEASGTRQIVVVDPVTRTRTAITHDAEPVFQIEAVSKDESTVWYSGYRDRGRQLQVFSTSLSGTARAPTPITHEEGMHRVVFDDAARFFIDTHSQFGVPAKVDVKDQSGQRVTWVDDNHTAAIGAFCAPALHWLDLTAADGKTTLNGLLLEPQGLDASKKSHYPVITYLYGGPTAQMVAKQWMRLYPLFLHWTQQGYGVFVVDNRGMAGRDRAFGRAHHMAVGEVEVADVFASVEQLKKSHVWIDGQRIGMFGWSYGGFMAARLMLDDNTPFACAAGGAPVTDWSLYDTHYTERYMGLPKNANGTASSVYQKTNLSQRATLLKKPLLLLHGTADDNVLFEHTLRLSEALQQRSLPFELMVYPGKAHGVSGRAAQLHVHRTVSAFFDRCLKPTTSSRP